MLVIDYFIVTIIALNDPPAGRVDFTLVWALTRHKKKGPQTKPWAGSRYVNQNDPLCRPPLVMWPIWVQRLEGGLPRCRFLWQNLVFVRNGLRDAVAIVSSIGCYRKRASYLPFRLPSLYWEQNSSLMLPEWIVGRRTWGLRFSAVAHTAEGFFSSGTLAGIFDLIFRFII